MTTVFRPGTIEMIRATPSVLRTMFDGLPDDVLTAAGAEGWSPRDVVGHLVVAGRLGALDRVRRALVEEMPSFAGYDEAGELDASGLRAEPCGELIALLERERARHPALGAALSGAELARAGVHREVGRVTVAELLHQAGYHDSLHVAQIASLLSAYFEGGRGPLSVAQT